jgi:hypothetical protein
MKNTLKIFLILILTFSCSKNDFENTNLYLEFDKEIYKSNDNFELTIRIVPIEAEKTIRLYKNLNNIEVSFLSKAKQLAFYQELNTRFIEGPIPNKDESEYIDEFTISKEKPFEKKLFGSISESENKIVFEIPDLQKTYEIDKSSLLENPNVLIKGNCRTIFGIGVEPFEPNEIKIKVE